MHGHGRAVKKFFLLFKRIADGNMANQQGALPDPDAACDPATEAIVNIEFDILDVERQIVEVASILTAKVNMASFCDYHVSPDRFSSLTTENRLKLLHARLGRLWKLLAPDSASFWCYWLKEHRTSE